MKSESLVIADQHVAVNTKWKEEGKTILMVNHDLSKVKEYFDHVVLVKHGIVASGKTEEVFISKYLDHIYGGNMYIPQGGEQHA